MLKKMSIDKITAVGTNYLFIDIPADAQLFSVAYINGNAAQQYEFRLDAAFIGADPSLGGVISVIPLLHAVTQGGISNNLTAIWQANTNHEIGDYRRILLTVYNCVISDIIALNVSYDAP